MNRVAGIDGSKAQQAVCDLVLNIHIAVRIGSQ